MARPGVRAIVFSDTEDIKFLLLHRVLNWTGWEFPKGGIDEGESAEQAVFREVEEEAGLTKIEIIEEVGKTSFQGDQGLHEQRVFLVRTDEAEQVKLPEDLAEHDDFRWVAEKEVLDLLHWDNEKDIFKKSLSNFR